MHENPYEPSASLDADETQPRWMPIVETIALVGVVGGLILSALASVIWIAFSSTIEFHNG